MDERFGVDVFDTRDELICKKQDGLQREFAIAEVEKVLQTRTKKVQNHSIVITFCSEPADERDTNTSGEGFVDTGLIFKLRMLGFDTLKFDSNLLSRDYIGAYITISSKPSRDTKS